MQTTVCLDSPFVAAMASRNGPAISSKVAFETNRQHVNSGQSMQPARPVAAQIIASTAPPIQEMAAMTSATNDTVCWRAESPRLGMHDDFQRVQTLLDEMIEVSEETLNETVEADSFQQSYRSDAPEIQQVFEPAKILEPVSDDLPSVEPPSQEPPSQELRAQEPRAQEPPPQEPPPQEPPSQEPASDVAPANETPVAQEPTRQTPSHEPVSDEIPANEQPAAKDPARQTPTVDPQPAAVIPNSAQAAEPVQPPKAWAPATALAELLNDLSASGPVQTWSNAVLAELTRVEELNSVASPEAAIYLDRLRASLNQADQLANELTDRSEQIAMRQAAYTLQRQLDVWMNVHDAARNERSGLLLEMYNSVRLETMLAKIFDVRQTLSRFAEAADWEQYLLLDLLEQAAQGQGPFRGAARIELAQLALDRIHDSNLSAQQQAVLNTQPVVHLDRELRVWATHPVSHTNLLAALERFEQQSTPAAVRELTNYWRDLRWSSLPTQNQLAQTLDRHYRNANIRFAVSEEMLNRLVPAVREYNSPVRSQVLGAQVKGHSNSRLRLLVKLLPDRSRLRLMFEARGITAMRTAATKGPVTLFSRNRSDYRVRKIVLLDESGPRSERSQASASGNSSLTGMRTNFDHVPIIGPLVRNRARQRHQEQTGIARRIFVNRVKDEARTQVDQQIEKELAEARLRLEKKIIGPLRQLDLQPQALEMETLEDRMVLRGRLAASHQLAAYTARPRAHSGNLLSAQIHESALNNFVEQLGLDGREAELQELFQDLSAKLRAEVATIPEQIPEGVRIRFADEGAVRFACDNETVTLTLRIAELHVEGERTWKNFEVYADYRPQQTGAGGVDVYFSRDGGIRLSRTRRRFPLRAIFTKVLSPNRRFYLIKPGLAEDERLADLNTTQLRITDGWIGLSIGKESPSASLTRRETTQR